MKTKKMVHIKKKKKKKFKHKIFKKLTKMC